MATSARSFADDLRARDDAELEGLLALRPDLAMPLPSDLGQLAARALTTGSTQRAVDRLDTFALHVLQASLVAPEPVSAAAVRALLPDAARADVEAVLKRLRLLGLLWGEPDQWRPTATVRELFGAGPAGLGPPWAALQRGGAPPDPASLPQLLDQAPDGVRAVIDQLTWGPPHGSVARADRYVAPDTARSPVEWLLAHEVLVPLDAQTVVLPRETALALRGGRLFADDASHPPDPGVVDVDAARVDRAGAGAAFDAVRRVDDVLESWSLEPPPVLRSGGLGVRELRATASLLGVDDSVAALVVEVAFAAGLLTRSEELDDRWLPTPAYDRWREQPVAQRWVDLVTAWLDSTRATGLVGSRDDREQRRNALAPDLDRIVVPEIRRAVLDDLAQLRAKRPGTAPAADALVMRQRWRLPRRGGPLRDDLVRWSLSEATELGVVALGALTTAGAHVVADEPERAEASLAPLLPQPVDHVLIQADLTAVAPGPLAPPLARELALAADVESSGGATVYRFSEASVRRALDAGRSATDLHALLAGASRTPVPQPLTYLIDDVARRHGRVRVGTASAYVRCDDPAVLDEVLAHRMAPALRLRRLAPTVAAAGAGPDVVLDRLRAMNMAPVAESLDGEVVLRRRDAQRSPERPRPARLGGEPATSPTVLTAAVRALRTGERGGGAGERVVGPAGTDQLPRTAVADTLAALRGAAQAHASVWIGYVGDDGTARDRVVDPVEVRGGWLTAFDHRHEQLRTFAVHRITGVARLP